MPFSMLPQQCSKSAAKVIILTASIRHKAGQEQSSLDVRDDKNEDLSQAHIGSKFLACVQINNGPSLPDEMQGYCIGTMNNA